MLAGGTFHLLKLRILRRLNRLSAARTIKLNLVHGVLNFDSSAANRWLESFLLVNLGQCFVNQIQRVVEIGTAPHCTRRQAPGVLLL